MDDLILSMPEVVPKLREQARAPRECMAALRRSAFPDYAALQTLPHTTMIARSN